MAMRQCCPLTLIASLVMVVVLGCGPAEPDAVTEDDSTGEPTLAAGQTECVNIIHRYNFHALEYSYSNDQVVTGLTNPPAVRVTWCLQLVSSLRYRIRPYDLPTKYLDAYETCCDNNVVYRDQQNDNSQVWEIIPDAPLSDALRIKQVNTGRYLDAYVGTAGGVNRAVTRTVQHNDTQRWYVDDAGCTCS